MEGVWNTEFYKPIFLQNRTLLRKNIYGVIKLRNITSKITKGETPLWRGDKYQEEGVTFIKSENVLENKLSLESHNYIDSEVHERMKRSQLRHGDVLFNIVGASIGRACVYNLHDEANINQAVCLIRLKDSNYSPEWLSYILNSIPYQTWINQLKSGGARDNIDLNQINDFEIPKHPLNVQHEIVKKMEVAYASKRAKEAEAASLLASIDSYLLEQLGVTLPEVTEKKKVFLVCSDKVSGGRFDPKLYLPSTRGLIDCLFSTKYQYKPLKHLITHSVSGDWGIENFEEGFEECLVIRATEFDNRYNLRLENSRVKYRFIAKTKLQKLDIQPNDLLIEKSGGSIDQPVGRIAILTKELTQGHKLAFSNFVHKIRLSADVNSDFAYFYLNTLHSVKVTDVMQSQTNGIRNLIMKEYFNLPIPLPSIEIQTNIAAHITAIRSQAQQLETEAKATVEAAKKEVEAIILGEGGGSA